MSPERRTLAAWVHHLTAPDAQLTLSELMALCLIRMHDDALLAREGTQHLEGMLGTFDALFAQTHPLYGELAAKRSPRQRGLPEAESP